MSEAVNNREGGAVVIIVDYKMPTVKLLHVCSSSSEDPNHPASNLLNPDTYRKWACATGGEKQAVIVLQLEKSASIHAIDIGNNGSAFVEVMVGRSTNPDEYQVLLVSSTFMSPADSKSWTNTNRVRMFGKDKLCKSIAEQKWDRVKVVCTQPYNKTEKYGLTFIKLQSPPEAGEGVSEEGKIGAFKLREDIKDLPPGSFFRKEQQQKEEKQPKPAVTAAAQARMASAAALKDDSANSSAAAKVPSANTTSSGVKGSGLSLSANKDSDRGMKSADKAPIQKPAEEKAPPAKKTKVDGSTKSNDIHFEDIMRGVVFVLSGFKNPYRTELRDKAIAMGARYEGDWGPGCTHLVCAFSNTPKFSQVKAQKGLIVKKEWILECHRTKKRLPAKQFRLSSGSEDSEAEDELYDLEEEKIYKKGDKEVAVCGKDHEGTTSTNHQEGASIEIPVSSPPEEKMATVPCDKEVEADDPYGGSTDEEAEDDDYTVKPKLSMPSEDDNTDEEIERIKHQAEYPCSSTTEELCTRDKEQSSSSNKLKDLKDLPEFFSKFHFLLYGNFSTNDRKLLTRYITAYNGSVKDYMDVEVTHVVTQEPWDDKFDQALSENNALVFVRPKWIFACHQKQSCVPCQPYLVVAM